MTHPQYQEPNRQSNDIALLHLSENAVFNDDVWPVCLPNRTLDVTGKTATVAGWGQTSQKPNGTNAFDTSKLEEINLSSATPFSRTSK